MNQAKRLAKIAIPSTLATVLLAGGLVPAMMAESAFAVPTDNTTITVSGKVDGHHFTAYKLASFGNVTITGGKATATVSSESAVKAKIASAAQTAGITVANGQDPADAVARESSSAKVQAFAKALAEAGLTQTAATDGKGSSATLNVTEGWYLVTDSKGLPMLVGTQIKSGNQTATAMKNGGTLGVIDIKSTSLNVDKKVKVGNSTPTDDGSASVGSVIGYEVTVPMPDPANVKTLKYQDTLTGGTITDTPTATIDGKTVAINPTVATNNTSFTVDLTNLLAANKGKTLVISYHAKTTAKTATNDAQLSGTDANGNTITPDNGGGKDTSTVNAYDFDLTKVDALSTGTKLQGAQFKIQKKGGAWLKQTDGGLWSDASGEADATVFATDAQGKTNFTGLGNGTYTIKEVTAPADHYLAGTFTFDANVSNGKTTFSGNSLVSALDGDSAQVKNNPTVNGLAKTGQGGLLLMGSAATVMAVIGAGCAIAYKRQKRAD